MGIVRPPEMMPCYGGPADWSFGKVAIECKIFGEIQWCFLFVFVVTAVHFRSSFQIVTLPYFLAAVRDLLARYIMALVSMINPIYCQALLSPYLALLGRSFLHSTTIIFPSWTEFGVPRLRWSLALFARTYSVSAIGRMKTYPHFPCAFLSNWLFLYWLFGLSALITVASMAVGNIFGWLVTGSTSNGLFPTISTFLTCAGTASLDCSS